MGHRGHGGFPPPGRRESGKELVLAHPAFVRIDQAVSLEHVELDELASDLVLVVELGLGDLGELLGEPDGAANRRERQREESADQPNGPSFPPPTKS